MTAMTALSATWPKGCSVYALLLLSAVAGLFLGIVGVAPLLSTLLFDLHPDLSNTLVLNVVVGLLSIMFGVVMCATIVLYRRSGQPGKLRRFGFIAATSVSLSTVAALFLYWESDNLNSWRFSRALEAESGSVKHTAFIHGTHYQKLSLGNNDSSAPLLGSIRVFHQLRASGGTLGIATRIADAGDALPCVEVARQRAEVESKVSRPSTGIIFLNTFCGQWTVSHVDLPPGFETIELRAVTPLPDVEVVELGFVSLRYANPIFRSIVASIAFGLMIACVVSVVWNLSLNYAAKDERLRQGQRWRLDHTMWAMASMLIFVVVANAGVYSFVSKERTIYAWDFGGHWMNAVSVSRAISPAREGPGTANDADVGITAIASEPAELVKEPGPIRSLVRNLRYQEYNVTAAIPLAIPMSLWEGSRMSYTLSLANVYGLSAVVALILVSWIFVRRQSNGTRPYWLLLPAIAVLLLNPFWVPLLRGYIGVCVVAVNLLVYWLYFRRPLGQQELSSLILISILLAVSVIMRRWNAYWVVAFFAIALMDAIYALLAARSFSLNAAARALRGVFVVGLGAMVALAVMAWPLVVTMLTTDYSDIYSAYADSDGSISAHADHFVRTFGVGLIGVTVLSAVYLIMTSRSAKDVLLIVIQVSIVLVHVSSTQEMGPHHMYLLMPGILVILVLAGQHALAANSKLTRAIGAVFIILFVANGVASHISVFVPDGGPVRRALVPIVPDNRRTPLVRNDIAEFRRLANYLDEKLASAKPSTSIYVLSSSPIFNVGTLNMLEISTGIPFQASDRLLRTADVDKRDGFPKELLRADVVLVASPIQYHHSASEQSVIGIPAQMMLGKVGIGNAFEALPFTVSLDEGVKVHVYRRVRPNEPDEVLEMSERLREIYPDRPEIYGY